MAHAPSIFARWKSRRVWADPYRKYRTLASFSETEDDGGKDLVRAARRVRDPELRAHIERHASDEVRHARLFRTRAAEVASEFNLAAHGGDVPDLPYDLARKRPGLEMDAHGFFNAGLIDELGELEYVAMLHVAERRAAELFEMHASLNASDAKTRAVFEEILRDEKYHVAYTRTFLEKWTRQGRGAEVDRALKDARGSRFFGAWKRLGIRSAAGLSRALLFVMYWTLLAPFGLVSHSRPIRGALQPPRPSAKSAHRLAQY
jgi:rubrerythrin